MRKLFTKIALCFIALGLGVTTTGCGDNEIINNLLDILIGGKSYIYSGDYTMQMLYGYNEATGKFTKETPLAEYPKTKVELKAGIIDQSSVTLTVPGTEFFSNGSDSATMSDVVLSNLSLKDGKLSDGSSTMGTGTLTFNGVEMPYYACDMEGTATSEELNIKALHIYFGEEGDHVVTVTFANGKVVSE